MRDMTDSAHPAYPTCLRGPDGLPIPTVDTSPLVWDEATDRLRRWEATGEETHESHCYQDRGGRYAIRTAYREEERHIWTGERWRRETRHCPVAHTTLRGASESPTTRGELRGTGLPRIGVAWAAEAGQ